MTFSILTGSVQEQFGSKNEILRRFQCLHDFCLFVISGSAYGYESYIDYRRMNSYCVGFHPES